MLTDGLRRDLVMPRRWSGLAGGSALIVAMLGGCASEIDRPLSAGPGQPTTVGGSSPQVVAAVANAGSVLAGDPQTVAYDRRMAALVEFGLDDDRGLKAYLGGLLSRITRDAGLPEGCCRVEIVETYSLDAYSKPSGTVFVTIGWLLNAGSEDELVALLAHETGHIAKNHYRSDDFVTGTTAARQLYLAGAFVVSIAKKTQISLTFDRPLQYTARVTSQIIHPSLSREQELEADRFAIDTSARLGYSMKDGTKAFLERLASLEEGTQRAAIAQAQQSELAQQLKEMFDALARKHDTARDRLNTATAYYEQSPPVVVPMAAPRAKGKSGRVDGWKTLQASKSVAALMTAYRNSSEANEAIEGHRYVEASLLLRKIDAKMLSMHLLMAMSQCRLYEATGDLAKANACFDSALQHNFGSWKLYVEKADLLKRSGNAAGGLALLDDGYRRLGTPPEALPTLVDYSRDVNVERRNDYNARCMLTTVALRQACADALTSPAEKQAATDAETKRLSDKMMAPVTKALDKLTPKTR